jgi:hypothetical protein
MNDKDALEWNKDDDLEARSLKSGSEFGSSFCSSEIYAKA